MFFKNNKCYIISWDQNYSIYAVYAYNKSNKITILDSYTLNNDGNSLKIQLEKIYSSFIKEKNPIVILSGYFPQTSIINIEMPLLEKKELKEAISLEIPRKFPFPIEDINWHYIIKNETNNKLNIKVCAISKSNINDFIQNAQNMTMDALIYPFMLSNTDNIQLKNIDENFICNDRMTPSMSEIKELSFNHIDGMEKIDIENFATPLLVASYVLQNNIDENLKIELPQTLITKRYKSFKLILYSISFILTLLISSLLFRYAQTSYQNNSKITKEIKNIKVKIDRLKRKNRMELHEDSDYSAMKLLLNGNYGFSEFTNYISFIESNIPDNVWVEKITSAGEKIRLTLKSEKTINTSSFENSDNFIIKGKKTELGGKRIYLDFEYTRRNNE